MRYIKYLSKAIFAISATAFLWGCDDYLDRDPSDLINEQKTFSNIDNAEGVINNAYEELPSLVVRESDSQSSFFNLGSGTDEGADMLGNSHTAKDFNLGNWSAASFPLDYTWFTYYKSIRIANVFLKNFDRIPDEVRGVSQSARKDRMYGEAYGLRAFYYFLLYTAWGEVPLLKDPILPGDANSKVSKSSINDVVAFIDQNLQTAIQHLPTKQENSEYGRITSTACKAILSRLYLYYASPLSNPTNDVTRWQKAEDMSEQAIDFAEKNGYELSLTPSNGKEAYERIFLEQNNPEVIWSDIYPWDGYVGGTSSYWDFWAGSLADGAWDIEGPLQEMVDSYETTNGEIPVLGYNADNTQIVNTKANYDPKDPYANRDKRFYQTILYQGAKWKGRTIDVSSKGADYTMDRPRIFYFWKKYIQEEHNLYTGSGFTQRRYILFRLSELYLNYAEARNEVLDNPDSKVYEKVNILRSRAGLPNLPENLTKEEMREKIRHERKVEFVMENQRFWDVRRWKIAENVDNKAVHCVKVDVNGNYTYPVWHTRVFDKTKHYLFPIPQSEIDKAGGVLKQNPGW